MCVSTCVYDCTCVCVCAVQGVDAVPLPATQLTPLVVATSEPSRGGMLAALASVAASAAVSELPCKELLLQEVVSGGGGWCGVPAWVGFFPLYFVLIP